MCDPISELEQQLAAALPADTVPSLFAVIDQWRHHHAGNRTYIARHSYERRQAEIVKLAKQGVKPADIAKQIGVTKSWVYAVTSSYLK